MTHPLSAALPGRIDLNRIAGIGNDGGRNPSAVRCIANQEIDACAGGIFPHRQFFQQLSRFCTDTFPAAGKHDDAVRLGGGGILLVVLPQPLMLRKRGGVLLHHFFLNPFEEGFNVFGRADHLEIRNGRLQRQKNLHGSAHGLRVDKSQLD